MKMRGVAVTLALAATVAFATPPSLAQESKDSSFTKIPTVKGIETLKKGAKAPDFKVQDLEGKEFHLASCCGKDAVLLFFWSFFCGPCRDEMPMISQMAQVYQGKGLQVVGVNLDGREMKKAIDKFVANEKIEVHPTAQRDVSVQTLRPGGPLYGHDSCARRLQPFQNTDQLSCLK